MMFQTRFLSRSLLAAAAALLLPATARAQLDRVYPVDGRGVTGTVVNVVRDGVQLKSGDSTQAFRIDRIEKVTFEGDPGPLTRGRELALEGQYQSAIEQLRTIDYDDIRREYIAADAAFYLASSQARLALAGQGPKNDAVRQLRAFVSKFPQSMHFYEAAELLGDLAISVGEYEQAGRFYNELTKSRAPSVKTRAVYLLGLALLRQGKPAEALEEFRKVADAQLETTEGARLKILARAGLAVALAQTGEGQAALDQANTLVEELNPQDAEMAARIYNARGAANQALGDTQGALLDYLHTHLLFSSVADAHAEALSELVKLWPEVGKPDQAALVREELQTRYPGWGG
jgi:TolA-binding protein